MVKPCKSISAPTKDLFFVGASYRTAAASERQHLALPGQQMVGLHATVAQRFPGAEFCMLSTCNRAEFYLAAAPSDDVLPALAAVICSHCPHFETMLTADKIRFQRGLAVYEHVLRVSCGLESSVLGDTQIIQQIRQSLQMARKAGSTGAYLEQAFGRALSLGSRVRRETDISVGSPGVAAAICETITAWRGEATAKAACVLLIGAGTINAGVARSLAHNRSLRLLVINRSLDKAQRLADQFSGEALPWSQLSEAIAQAAVIVAATSSSEPVITASMLEATELMYDPGWKLVVDAGMPPNVESCSLPGIRIVGIDELSQRQDEQLSRRRIAIADVEAAIEQELALWDRWLAQRPLETLLKSLYLDLEELPQRISQHLACDDSPASGDLHYIIHRHLKQLLHPHVMDLRRMVRTESSHCGSAIEPGEA
ncbi:MAG: glutamyl-tRNA reductase [Aureliella sp.]